MTRFADVGRVLAGASVAAALIAGCSGGPSKADIEAVRNTFACSNAGERIVVRFDQGEARLLLASGERVTLYQVPSGSGVRYTNGNMDLYGKALDLRFAKDGAAPVPLENCAPLSPETKPEDRPR